MKKFLILALIMFFNVLSHSQVMPEAFLGMLPSIPNNPCADKKENIEKYIAKLDSISTLIDNELARRNEEIENNSEKYEEQAMNKAANDFGLSKEEMEKLQNDKNHSKKEKEEKEALINKALKNKYDISLKQVDKLKKLDKNGREAWAEAYATQKMAEMQSDPDKYKDEQLQNKNLYELGALQKHITDSLTAIESKFAKQFDAIENDPEQKKMLDSISKLKFKVDELMGGEGGASKEFYATFEKLKSEINKYCNKFTPKYLEILGSFEAYTRSCLPACYKLEKIIAQQTKLQTGVEMKQEPGYIGIGKIAAYLGALRGAYKYNLKNTTLGMYIDE